MKKTIVSQTKFKSQVGDFDALAMAELLESTLLASRTTGEHKTKKSFSPSSVGYGDGTCPRRWFISTEPIGMTTDSVELNKFNGLTFYDRWQKLFEETGVLVETEEILCDNPIPSVAR